MELDQERANTIIYKAFRVIYVSLYRLRAFWVNIQINWNWLFFSFNMISTTSNIRKLPRKENKIYIVRYQSIADRRCNFGYKISVV